MNFGRGISHQSSSRENYCLHLLQIKLVLVTFQRQIIELNVHWIWFITAVVLTLGLQARYNPWYYVILPTEPPTTVWGTPQAVTLWTWLSMQGSAEPSPSTQDWAEVAWGPPQSNPSTWDQVGWHRAPGPSPGTQGPIWPMDWPLHPARRTKRLSATAV